MPHLPALAGRRWRRTVAKREHSVSPWGRWQAMGVSRQAVVVGVTVSLKIQAFCGT